MKLNLNAVILDLDDKPVKKSADCDAELTLQDVIINSLMALLDEDRQASGERKLTLFSLALDIKNGKDELTAEEVALIKERIGKSYGQLIVGRSFKMIENDK